MALSANRKIPTMVQVNVDGGGVTVDIPVGAAEEIYEGAFVSFDAGDKFLAPLAAGEVSGGIALQRVTGVTANGTKTCKTACGCVFVHALTSVAMADIGKDVYASDDNTLTLVSTSNSHIGWILNVPVTGTCIVKHHMPGMAP